MFAGKGINLSNIEHQVAVDCPSLPILPDNFFSELEKIESFYDAHLADLFPNIFAENGSVGQIAHPTEMNRTQANSGETVR